MIEPSAICCGESCLHHTHEGRCCVGGGCCRADAGKVAAADEMVSGRQHQPSPSCTQYGTYTQGTIAVLRPIFGSAAISYALSFRRSDRCALRGAGAARVAAQGARTKPNKR